MAERAGSHTSKPRLPIIRAGAAILAIVAALSFAQRIRAVTHRYDDVDFAIFYGWWTDYSSGGDPWVVQSKKIDLRPGLSRPHYCNYRSEEHTSELQSLRHHVCRLLLAQKAFWCPVAYVAQILFDLLGTAAP